jgi:hypothetical protein
MTAEAVKAPVIGRLLTVRSCTDGEKVVGGGSRLRSETRRRGDARRRRRDGLTSGGAERDRVVRCARTVETTSLKHARSGGALAARRRRGFGQRRLQTGDDLV